ncbi:hypothetical protein LEP1GSC123_1121 [Leptospira borgpetersenii str. 200701203]|uniref:Uncharacterized protein n=1 Tax=Leptospira borgpetersenii str. 200701203 TaxID=1193007 RepID=M3HJ43_LEPBO|nr:hypothetical protein LEP1GSC123_1121 [Leptospira borgpetersenii str. 200701203]
MLAPPFLPASKPGAPEKIGQAAQVSKKNKLNVRKRIEVSLKKNRVFYLWIC